MQVPQDDLAETYLQSLPQQQSPLELLASHAVGAPMQIVPDNLAGVHAEYHAAAAEQQDPGAAQYTQGTGQMGSSPPVDGYHSAAVQGDAAHMHHQETNEMHPSEVNAVHQGDVNRAHHQADVNHVHHQADVSHVHHQADVSHVHHDVNTVHQAEVNHVQPGEAGEVHQGDVGQVHQHHQQMAHLHHAELTHGHLVDVNQVHHGDPNAAMHGEVGPQHREDMSQLHVSHVHPGQVHPNHVHPSQVHPSQLLQNQVHPSQVHPGQVHPSQVHQGQVQEMDPSQAHNRSLGQLAVHAQPQEYAPQDYEMPAGQVSSGLLTLTMPGPAQPPPAHQRRGGRSIQSVGKLKAMRAAYDEDAREAKRKRIISANSLQNLQHKKVCPSCGKNHGNAKKGECRNTLPNGEMCTYIFGVKPTARSMVSAPIGEQLPAPGTQRHFKAMHAHFLRLVNEAKNWASKTGMSVAVFATGAVHTSHKPSEPCENFMEDVFIKNARLGDSKLKVATFKYGTGGAARTLTNNFKVLDFISNVTADNLADACGGQEHMQPEEPASPMKVPDLHLGSGPDSPTSSQPPTMSLIPGHHSPGLPKLENPHHGQPLPPHMHPNRPPHPHSPPPQQIQLTPGGPSGSFHQHHHGHGAAAQHGMEHHHMAGGQGGEGAPGLQHQGQQHPQLSHYRPNSQGMLMMSRAAEMNGRALDPAQHQLSKLQTLDAFLQSVNCSQYLESMKKEDVDMTALLFCSEEDLHNLGLPLGARKRIMEALKWGRLENIM